MAEERSVSDVFQDILRNLPEMVRSEIRLAKVEYAGRLSKRYRPPSGSLLEVWPR